MISGNPSSLDNLNSSNNLTNQIKNKWLNQASTKNLKPLCQREFLNLLQLPPLLNKMMSQNCPNSNLRLKRYKMFQKI